MSGHDERQGPQAREDGHDAPQSEAPAGSDSREQIRLGTARARWVIVAAVLGTGVAFLDSTVVNAALPAIARSFNSSLSGQQWVVTGYLLTLGSLLVLGGSLGDLFGRKRLFLIGLVGFGLASALCGLAPNLGVLVAARMVQGVAAAALVPGSLAIISSSFHPVDRPKAIGTWTGLAGIASAAGPFLGGWLIDAVSWRLVFLINLPLITSAVLITVRHLPESRDEGAARHIDQPGALTLSLGLAGVVYALIEGPAAGWSALPIVAAIAGVASLVAFGIIEARLAQPMVPLSIFRVRQFSGANAVTFTVWGALGAVLFLLVVHLQQDLGYSALEAGASTLPVTVLMLLFAARGGALAQRIGPRVPMTVGPLIIAGAFVLFSRVQPGRSYAAAVLPAVVVLGIGLVITVAPLTTAVLGAITESRAGLGSAVNNAVARIAGLLAVAVLPAVAGATGRGGSLGHAFSRAMLICCGLCVAGALTAWSTIIGRPASFH